MLPGPKNFDVIYDDDVWSAAIIQVGRFGVVYSAVLRVRPQYGLRQTTTQTDWEIVRVSTTTVSDGKIRKCSCFLCQEN
jgi:hypothetical protein